MCGRFTLAVPDRLQELFPEYRFPRLTPRFNVAPSTPVLAVRGTGGGIAEFIEWGRTGAGATLINARVETIDSKPAFRDAASRRRAIVFADGYYEWGTAPGVRKQPYHIRRPDGLPFAFAALWNPWHDPAGTAHTACTIVTAPAPEHLAWIHDRMPVIVDDAVRERWMVARPLEPSEAKELLAQAAPVELVATAVSSAVNKAWRDDDPSLLDPVSPPSQGSLF